MCPNLSTVAFTSQIRANIASANYKNIIDRHASSFKYFLVKVKIIAKRPENISHAATEIPDLQTLSKPLEISI